LDARDGDGQLKTTEWQRLQGKGNSTCMAVVPSSKIPPSKSRQLASSKSIIGSVEIDSIPRAMD
jgi:hypothetical protein